MFLALLLPLRNNLQPATVGDIETIPGPLNGVDTNSNDRNFQYLGTGWVKTEHRAWQHINPPILQRIFTEDIRIKWLSRFDDPKYYG